MLIECYCICWNEAETIHLTIKHYQQFCSRIILYDNYSDDGTPDIARQMGCEVKQFGIPGVLDDREYTKLKNNCWKGSDADWVIVVDADEVLWYPENWSFESVPMISVPYLSHDMLRLSGTYSMLIEAKGTIFKSYGWNVFHEDVPREKWTEIKNGFYDHNYSKICIFNPREIKEINYVHGCHVAKPNGNIKWCEEVPILFHYRNVGGTRRLIDRHALYRSRMSDWNKKWNAGVHYTYEDERRIREWEEQFQKSKPFSQHGTLYLGQETTHSANPE